MLEGLGGGVVSSFSTLDSITCGKRGSEMGKILILFWRVGGLSCKPLTSGLFRGFSLANILVVYSS